MDGKQTFLSRWSRRKLEAKQDVPAAMPAEKLPAAAPAAPLPAATQAPAAETSAGMSAEYREFFDPQVAEKLRQSALKRLFSDPQFNVMDGLDTYIDDYSIPDPIPEAMLRQLNQAKALFLFDEEQKVAEGGGSSAPRGEDAVASAVAAADPGALPETPSASATDESAGAAAPPREAIRND